MDQLLMTSKKKLNLPRLGQIHHLLLHILISLLLLYLFLVGIKLLSSSIKLMGGEFAHSLFDLGGHPFIGLFSGILATVLFQSSSVTTSVIVGLVSTGTLPLSGAVPMIMGANIGTSVTNTIVSIGHIRDSQEFKRAFAAATIHDFFNILTVMIILPLELMTGLLAKLSLSVATALYGVSKGLKYESPVKAAIRPLAKSIQNLTQSLTSEAILAPVLLVISCLIIVATLFLIVKNMRKLVEGQIAPYVDKLLGHPVVAIFFGIIVTISVQSSSITTSLLVPLAGSGILGLSSIFPVTIGANIGTTTTALIAALAGNLHGLAIALVHLFFNLIGMLIWYPIKPMRQIPMTLAEKFSEKVAQNKIYAIVYTVGVFFLIPLGLIILSR